MTALLQNFVGGSLNATLSAAGTVMASLALESVGVVTSPDTMTIVLDPDGIAGAPEIVVITDHAFGANTATITRGQEATVIREHKSGTNWVHSMTVGLFGSVIATGSSGSGVTTQASAPSSPADYELWLDTDEPAPVTDPLQVVPSLLAIKSYDPATETTVATTSATFTDVDATNLVVTFTVPDSGQVLVRLAGRATAGTGTVLSWNLREGASDVPDSDHLAIYCSSNTNSVRAAGSVLVTGLTPGTTKTWKWGQARTAGTGSAETQMGGTYAGPAVMEVHDAATSQGTVFTAAGSNSVDDPTVYASVFGTASTYDYEFNGSGTSLPSGWSWVNQGDASYLERFGAGALIAPAITGTVCRLLVRNAPVEATWTMTAKVGINAHLTDYTIGALVIRDSATGRFQTIEVEQAVASGPFFRNVRSSQFASPTTYNAAIATKPMAGMNDASLYYRIRKNSATSYDFLFSNDGRGWVPLVLATNPTTYVANIDSVGFMFEPGTGSEGVMSIDWFRVRT